MESFEVGYKTLKNRKYDARECECEGGTEREPERGRRGREKERKTSTQEVTEREREKERDRVIRIRKAQINPFEVRIDDHQNECEGGREKERVKRGGEREGKERKRI